MLQRNHKQLMPTLLFLVIRSWLRLTEHQLTIKQSKPRLLAFNLFGIYSLSNINLIISRIETENKMNQLGKLTNVSYKYSHKYKPKSDEVILKEQFNLCFLGDYTSFHIARAVQNCDKGEAIEVSILDWMYAFEF